MLRHHHAGPGCRSRARRPGNPEGREAAEAALRKQPNWKLVKLENARHYLWLTHPADVVREMNAFLVP
ncbi:hypothetical protein ACN28S_65430 [Cystobacter fuscus]